LTESVELDEVDDDLLVMRENLDDLLKLDD
jgi:hypothetical protein